MFSSLIYHTVFINWFFCRDEVEQENYQERIVLQLAEHEEEEIDRIKEESRKRRQAILEKFKTQKSQQKHEPNLQETGKLFLKACILLFILTLKTPNMKEYKLLLCLSCFSSWLARLKT